VCVGKCWKTTTFVLAEEKKSPRSLAVVAVVLRVVCSLFVELMPRVTFARSSAYARMSTHDGKEIEIPRITNALNNDGEKADPWGIPALRVCGSE